MLLQLFGAAIMLIGFFMILKTEWFLRTIGQIEWAERVIGSTRSFFKILGVVLMFFGLTMIFEMFGGMVIWIFSPLFPSR